MKRAQITIFIFVAILLITILFLFVFFSNNQIKNNQKEISDKGILFENIFDCLNKKSQDSILILGLRGGYNEKPLMSMEIDEIFLSYYFYEGKIKYPSKKEVEYELSKIIESQIISCFKDDEISYNKPKINSSIIENEIIIEIDLEVYYDDSILSYKEKPIIINSSLYDILDVAEYITLSHNENQKYICINCLTNIAIEKGLYVDMIEFDENEILVIISDNYTLSDKFSFFFLNKYTGDETSKELQIDSNFASPIQ